MAKPRCLDGRFVAMNFIITPKLCVRETDSSPVFCDVRLDRQGHV